MKKTIITFIASFVFIVFANQTFAQVPQGFNYQAVARNSAGVLLSGTNLGVLLTVHQGSAGGTIVYSERQTPTTNQFGLFTVTVGQGTQISAGAFNAIDWSMGNYWLEVGLDVSGGTSYTQMGTSQLLSVPYAMFAGSSSEIPVGTSGQTLRHDGSNWLANDVLYNSGSKIGINTNTPQRDISIYGGSSFASLQFTSSTTTQGFYNGFSLGLNTSAGDAYIANHENQPISIYTNATTRMKIGADGKIGIGTTAPTGLLDISGGGSGLGFPTLNVVNSDATGVGAFIQTNSTDASIVVTNSNATGNTIFAKYFDGGAFDLINFDNYEGLHYGRIKLFAGNTSTSPGGMIFPFLNQPEGGLVLGSINNATSTLTNIVDLYTVAVGSNIFEPYWNNVTSCGSSSYKWTSVWATNGVIQTSDEKQKENIKDISYGLNTVMALKPVSYQWKDKNALVGNGNSLGFVAQDLEKVIPDVVVHNKITAEEIAYAKKAKGIDITETDTYGVKYSEMIPVLVNAIQQQQAIIKDLQTQIDDLKALNNTK
jgi:hypothetical protein